MLCSYYAGFILVSESISMKMSKWCLMDPNCCTEGSDACPLICGVMPSVHAFFKGEKVLLFCNWLSRCAHVLVVLYEVAIVLQSKSINLFRDAATGQILSLATNHMCLLCSLDFGICIQWSGCMNCFWLYFLLLLILHPCRFSFHMQAMILMRYYYRLSNLDVSCVDGCCLYIIIHNSMSHRTWL